MDSSIQTQISDISKKTEGLSIEQSLKLLSDIFKGFSVFSSSFSIEDQAITHAIFSQQLDIDVFTLDTGRVFPETYSVWSSTNQRYEAQVKAYYPNFKELEKYLTQKGPNAFYESVENRKQCCNIRKVEPLKRALIGKRLWITGLRSEHSASRQSLEMFEWDESNNIIKFHPLLNWPTEEVRKYITQHNIPYNTLHDKGFVSIGCAPCTRAIRPGEDFRAGRWWWEDADKKECGLHEHK